MGLSLPRPVGKTDAFSLLAGSQLGFEVVIFGSGGSEGSTQLRHWVGIESHTCDLPNIRWLLSRIHEFQGTRVWPRMLDPEIDNLHF